MTITRIKQTKHRLHNYTSFAKSLKLKGLTIRGGGKGVFVLYAGIRYNIPEFKYTFSADKDYPTQIFLWLDPEEEDNLCISLVLLDDEHDAPQPPIVKPFGHPVQLAWGTIPAKAETFDLHVLWHEEK